jgi:acetolactate decarboxylase
MYHKQNENRQRNTLCKIALTCCATLAIAGGCASHPVEVEQYGKMQEVLGGGAANACPSVSLTEALNTRHAYAVGALPRLEGEITVIDGQAYIARAGDHGLHVVGPTMKPADSAAMLTIAYVNRWESIKTDQDMNQKELEEFIAMSARERGLDLTRPFPYLIEGSARDLKLHVVNGACPMRPGARLTADQQPWRYEETVPVDATIVGFFAADSVGKMTHPGTSLHAHALFDVDGLAVTGHVERMAFAKGATLRLPCTNRSKARCMGHD